MDHACDSKPLNEDKLLQVCPWCRYKLRGLPIEHNCPECGARFDRRWQVFGGKSIPRKSLLAARPSAMFMGLVVAWVIVSAILLFFLGGSFAPLVTMVICCAPLWFVVAVYYLRPSRSIVLAPKGVLVFEGRNRRASYSWNYIDRACFDTIRGAIALGFGEDTLYFPMSKYFGSLVVEAERCVRAINSYPRDAASD